MNTFDYLLMAVIVIVCGLLGYFGPVSWLIVYAKKHHWLCHLNFHKWRYGVPVEHAFINDSERTCTRCGREEIAADWDVGAWGGIETIWIDRKGAKR